MRDGQRGMGLADRLEIGLYGFLVGLIVGIFIGWQFNFLVGTVLNALTVVALLALAAGVVSTSCEAFIRDPASIADRSRATCARTAASISCLVEKRRQSR